METVDSLSGPMLLATNHDIASFDCGESLLNAFLQKHALNNIRNRSSRTYVALRGNRVVGYYSLAAGSVIKADAPPRVTKGLGNYPVPIVLLARLAVDATEKGKGLGKALLKDAFRRSCLAADAIGCRALLVHAKDATAKSFYERFGFESSPTDDLHLYLLIKDIELTLKQTS